MVQLEEAVAAVYAEVDIHVSVSVGILTREQVERLKAAGVKRYNHNLESARSSSRASPPRTRGTSATAPSR